MASQRASASLDKFLSLIPEAHNDKAQAAGANNNSTTTSSAILDSRSASQTDLSLKADDKTARSDSTTSTVSTISDKSAGYLKLGNGHP